MTLYKLQSTAHTVIVRAKDEDDARMKCVERLSDVEFADDDAVTCSPIFSSGPGGVLCVSSR